MTRVWRRFMGVLVVICSVLVLTFTDVPLKAEATGGGPHCWVVSVTAPGLYTGPPTFIYGDGYYYCQAGVLNQFGETCAEHQVLWYWDDGGGCSSQGIGTGYNALVHTTRSCYSSNTNAWRIHGYVVWYDDTGSGYQADAAGSQANFACGT